MVVGAIGIIGATVMPQGWDTVYTSILNMIERPVAPMLAVRVETDWYAHETEFRYVLQPGEGITMEQSIPIGQVFFVPREPITMRQCTAEEIKAIEESRQEPVQRVGQCRGQEQKQGPAGSTAQMESHEERHGQQAQIRQEIRDSPGVRAHERYRLASRRGVLPQRCGAVCFPR